MWNSSRTHSRWTVRICSGGNTSELLRKIHLFDTLTERELEKIQKICVSETHAKDAILFHEGDLGNRCYLITKGAVRISKFIPNIGEEALAVLKAGDYFGEMALIDNFPRSAHAIANTDIEVLAIDKTELDLYPEHGP